MHYKRFRPFQKRSVVALYIATFPIMTEADTLADVMVLCHTQHSFTSSTVLSLAKNTLMEGLTEQARQKRHLKLIDT